MLIIWNRNVELVVKPVPVLFGKTIFNKTVSNK